MWRAYWQLTKPGIIFGNLITAAAGFFLASGGEVDWPKLLALLVGTALVIACGCVVNNVIDRRIDRRMARTKNRAVASGEVSVAAALVFGGVLGAIGFTLLILYTNAVTVAVGAVGLFFYLVMYSLGKRRSVYGTLIGSVAGATPIVAGYTAAAGVFDLGALLLFVILASWQLPHFYAIALFRLDDYRAAKLPVLPVAKGVRATKKQIVGGIGVFSIAAALLTVFGYTGLIYLLVMLVSGLLWLRLGLQGFKAPDTAKWARRMFGVSLVVLLTFSLLISIDTFLP